MQLLVRPDPFPDESLESYLLRLARTNILESYQLLSVAVREWLREHDCDAAGAFPLELASVNVCYAHQDSGLRVRALKLVEQLTENERLPLLRLALLHSNARFCNGYRAVFRDGVEIPRIFLRREGIPVCPLCLADSVYIPQRWHWKTYRACVQHECELLHDCPSCGRILNYMRDEIIDKCVCGYALVGAQTRRSPDVALQLSQLVSGVRFQSGNPLLNTAAVSIRNGALLWYARRQQSTEERGEHLKLSPAVFDGAVSYFEAWPSVLVKELQIIELNAEQRIVKDFNKTAFKHLYGDLLLSARWLPVSDTSTNFVLDAVVDYLTDLVDRSPKGKKPNLGDLLLTVPEAAALLASTQEQVYRLYREGYLELAFAPRLHQKLSPEKPAFFLRQVVELRQAHMPSDSGVLSQYLPAW